MAARRGAPAGRPLSPSSRTGTPFPRTFLPAVRKILSRLFRVFVHVYIHHFDRIAHMGSEAHVNTCYKHFYYFVKEFGLIDTKELEPLVSGRPGPSGLRPQVAAAGRAAPLWRLGPARWAGSLLSAARPRGHAGPRGTSARGGGGHRAHREWEEPGPRRPGPAWRARRTHRGPRSPPPRPPLGLA